MDSIDASSQPQAAPAPESATVSQPPAAQDAGVSVAADGLPEHLEALAPRGANADPTAWQDTVCNLATDLLPWLLKPDQCGDLYIGVLTSVVLGVPTALAALWLWLWRRRALRSAGARPDPACLLDSELLSRLQRLLLGLPRWQDPRARRRFVTNALGKGHPLLHDIDSGGSARDAAFAVVDACAGSDAGALCALLACVPREFGPDPSRDAELTALRELLRCDPPSP